MSFSRNDADNSQYPISNRPSSSNSLNLAKEVKLGIRAHQRRLNRLRLARRHGRALSRLLLLVVVVVIIVIVVVVIPVVPLIIVIVVVIIASPIVPLVVVIIVPSTLLGPGRLERRLAVAWEVVSDGAHEDGDVCMGRRNRRTVLAVAIADFEILILLLVGDFGAGVLLVIACSVDGVLELGLHHHLHVNKTSWESRDVRLLPPIILTNVPPFSPATENGLSVSPVSVI